MKEYNLSEREKEILLLILEGLTNKEIGEKLFISYRTVDTHRRNILVKTECRNFLSVAKLYYESKGLFNTHDQSIQVLAETAGYWKDKFHKLKD